MNFIYDILVNFNDNLYDFYEWNINDNITHIRKIPLFKVKTEILQEIKLYNINISLEFLNKIKNKTEKFTSRDVEKIEYVALFSDDNDVIAVKFSKNGLNYQLSKLLIDEQEDVLDVSLRCELVDIEYKILNKKKESKFKTRLQIEKINYLIKSLNKLEKNNEYDKLKYLYFECFDEREDSINNIIKKLKESIHNDKYEDIMYNFFKLISIN